MVLNVFLSPGLRVSSLKSIDSLMGVPVYVFHASFKSLSLFLIFVILITVCLGIYFFGLIFFEFLYTSWTWMSVFSRLKKFLFAALHGPEEWKLMFRIQQRFLGSNLWILPVHNTVNAINLMCTIAKITSKSYIDSICYRRITTKAYIIEQSPVSKTLQKIKLSSDTFNPN